MRRTRLVWFLAGLAVATLTNLGVMWFSQLSSDGVQSQYIVVSDQEDFPDGVPFPDRQIVEMNPEILKECGVRNFVIWQPEGTPDGQGVTSGFRPAEQSDQSVTCVFTAMEEGKIFGHMKSAIHPNDLAPEIIQFQKQEAALKNAQTH